jgi:demethylmenaquinone methyltransferase / 2-methoxy-6-polyprenyl-1,4-benzoquinol methylase
VSKPWDNTRSEYVSQMFGAIADHYDLMNWVMTLGQDQRWRRQAADVAGLSSGDVALDVAAGTGDLTFELARRVLAGGRAVGLDFAEPMLDIARRKAANREGHVTFVRADARALPYSDASFDAVTCAFGIRNVDDRLAMLREMVRVVKPGKNVVILELTPPANLLARQYMDRVIPRLGEIIAGAREAYTYLPASVGDFPDAESLGRAMQAAGLRRVRYRLLNFGTVALHWGMRPTPQIESSS